MSNIGLEIAFRARDIKLVRTDVGDKYVLEELLRTGQAWAANNLAISFFPRLSLAGDGMITTICLLRAINQERQDASRIDRGFSTAIRKYLSTLRSVRRNPFTDVPAIQKLAQETESQLGRQGTIAVALFRNRASRTDHDRRENQTQIETKRKGFSQRDSRRAGAESDLFVKFLHRDSEKFTLPLGTIQKLILSVKKSVLKNNS